VLRLPESWRKDVAELSGALDAVEKHVRFIRPEFGGAGLSTALLHCAMIRLCVIDLSFFLMIYLGAFGALQGGSMGAYSLYSNQTMLTYEGANIGYAQSTVWCKT
jgi:hypothetical protein